MKSSPIQFTPTLLQVVVKITFTLLQNKHTFTPTLLQRMHRTAYKTLLTWKNTTPRKPMLLRGARQVGKTTLVRQFSVEFDHFIELNLERKADHQLFDMDDVDKIIDAACLARGIIQDGKPMLVFIDEIQEAPKAIKQLRYFYEDRPELYVIAAGSLLEFALKKVPSFPVGRVEYLYLYPLNFIEYLQAIDQQPAMKAINSIPLPGYAHTTLINLFHEYAITGGMPEVVNLYLEARNVSILTNVYNQLWQAYKEDVKKYASNATERKIIRHVIDSAPGETDRIKFEKFGKSNYRSREVGEAMRTLDMAGIIRLVYPTTNVEPPVVTDYKKRPRLQFLDTGLINHILQFQGEMLALKDLNNLQRGKVIQHLVAQELVSIHDKTAFKLHFWVREEKESSSEVDLVYHKGKYIIPIEVKSGKQGKLRSLHQFIERTHHPYAIRMYAGEYGVEKHTTPGGKSYLLMNLPYYLGTKLPGYIDYFVDQYSL